MAGSAKGRTLVAPKGIPIRPTTDRVKEAIFSMLDADAMKRADEETDAGSQYARVLDLYAGSGALGIEALSRGASFADFVELNARARSAIVENLRRTGLTSVAKIHSLRAETAVSTFEAPYDLILADPPYDDASVSSVLLAIGHAVILRPRGTVVFEHARSRHLPARAGSLQLIRTRYYGTTAVSLFQLDTAQ